LPTEPNAVSYFKALCFFLIQIFSGQTTIARTETSSSSDNLSLATLDSYLNETEAAYEDLVLGSQKLVRWHNNEKRQTEFALIYLHGFSASRQEISPVTENLADQLGANVYYARLQGHGRSSDAMAEGTVEGWKTDARHAYEVAQLIGKKVILISTSTGGTLSAWLATQDFAKDLSASVMVSPNFGIKDRSAWIMRWSWGLQLAKWISGPYHSFEPQNAYHSQFWTERYPLEALVPMLNLVDEIRELDASKITTPHLIVYSPNDKVVDAQSTLEFVERMDNAAVKLNPFNDSEDPSQHVLAGKACSPSTTAALVATIDDYIKSLSL